jgi:hypothetical protein
MVGRRPRLRLPVYILLLARWPRKGYLGARRAEPGTRLRSRSEWRFGGLTARPNIGVRTFSLEREYPNILSFSYSRKWDGQGGTEQAQCIVGFNLQLKILFFFKGLFIFSCPALLSSIQFLVLICFMACLNLLMLILA